MPGMTASAYFTPTMGRGETSEPGTVARVPRGEVVRVDTGGRTGCSEEGEPYRFFVKGGDPSRVHIYFEGGGACWSWVTCHTLELHDLHADLGVSEDVNSQPVTSVEQITDRCT